MTADKPTADAVPRVPTDTALIAAARRGDVDAFDSLVDRHRDAAVRLARRTASGSTEDLVTETVAAVRAELRAAAGPVTAFRPYLLTSLRRQHSARARRGRRQDVPGRGAVAGLPADCVQTAAKSFRALPENAQVALWHTEVEGEPLLETGKLLGVEATAVAELTFSARDAVRAGQLAAHREANAAAVCRWTTQRLSGHVRHSLATKDAARVTQHLESCDACAAVLPAVEAVESDLPLLIATAVLGPAAEAYLGREGGATHARPRARLAALLHDAARPMAVAVSAIAVITAGLLGTMAFADEDAKTKGETARSSTFTVLPVAPAPSDDSGPASGSGASGADARTAGKKVTKAPQPQPLPERRTARPAPQVAAETPQAAPAAEPAATKLDLGVTSLQITPGAGPLGLPGLSFG